MPSSREMQPSGDERRLRLEALLFEALERWTEGGEDALEAFLGEHADDAADLRLEIDKLARVGLLPAPASGGPTFPERLGDFRLIERLGEGGMGVVYAAEQVSLGRPVALKLVRPENLFFPGARERFQREVRAVARMQHPGIVPVYVVGEEEGVPYFAMERVDGSTLIEVLRALAGRDPAQLTGADLARAIDREAPAPEEHEERARGALFEGTWSDACLVIARQVAEALEHAHGRGIVHRDVKPSNVAITRAGRAMLLDFGLALSTGSERLTRSGSQPGSLPYMSPEQVGGEREIDARSDVYSLGVLLYELLTLRPAFDEPSSEATRRRILTGDFPRPRRVRGHLPRDVETVVLTAMARERERRYASADELARDLGNLLARRPIEARRAGVSLRLVRWGQRHPRAAAAGLATLLLGFAGVAAFSVQQKVLGDQLALQRDRARESAEELRRLASEFLFDFHAAIAEVPGTTRAQKLVVERAERLLADLAAREDDGESYRRDRAWAHLRLGDVLGGGSASVGDWSEAARHYGEARRLFEALLELPETETSDTEGLRTTLEHWGSLEAADGSQELALELLREAVESARAEVEARPAAIDAERALVSAQLRLARALKEHGDVPFAVEALDEAAGRCEVLLGRDPGDEELLRLYAAGRRDLANLQAMGDETAAAAESFRLAAERIAPLAQRPDATLADRRLEAALLNGWFNQLYRLGRNDDALEVLARALERLEELVAVDPANVQTRVDLMLLLHRGGESQIVAGGLEHAQELLERGVEVGSALAQDGEGRRGLRTLGALHGSLGSVAVQRGDLDTALVALGQAVEILEPLHAEAPEDISLLQLLVNDYASLGRVLAFRGRQEEALVWTQRAIDLLEPRYATGRSPSPEVSNLAAAWNARADVLEAAGDAQGARAALERAVDLHDDLEQRDPDNAQMLQNLLYGRLRLGDLLLADEELDAAHFQFEAGARSAERLCGQGASDALTLDYLLYGWQRVQEIAQLREDEETARAAHERVHRWMEAYLESLNPRVILLHELADDLLDDRWEDLRDPALALRMAERGVAIDGRSDAAVLHTLARALHANGRGGEAIATAQEALDRLLEADPSPENDALGAAIESSLAAFAEEPSR